MTDHGKMQGSRPLSASTTHEVPRKECWAVGPCLQALRRPGSCPPLRAGRRSNLKPPRTALPGVDDQTGQSIRIILKQAATRHLLPNQRAASFRRCQAIAEGTTPIVMGPKSSQTTVFEVGTLPPPSLKDRKRSFGHTEGNTPLYPGHAPFAPLPPRPTPAARETGPAVGGSQRLIRVAR